MKKIRITILFIMVFSTVMIFSGTKLFGLKQFANKQFGENEIKTEKSETSAPKMKCLKSKVDEMENVQGSNNLKSGVYVYAYAKDDSRIGDFTNIINKENYSLDQAKEDGCVVFEDLDVTSGEKIWNDFVSVTKSGEPASVRLANYYTLDNENCAPEYYEAEKDNYPMMYVQDLTFDGQEYTIRWFEEGEEIVRKYKYLIRCDEIDCIRYILTNDNTVTWDDIFKQLISASLPPDGGIEFCSVYEDKLWK